MVPFVVTVLATYDARFGQSIGARVVLEVVRVRVDLPRDEDVVVLQDLRYHVRVEAPFDVGHHVLLRHQGFHEVIASGCPLGKRGDVVGYVDCHVLDSLGHSLSEVRQLRSQFRRGHDCVINGPGLHWHEDGMNDTWRLLGRAQEVLARHLGSKDLGENPRAHLRRLGCLRPAFDRGGHGVGSAFSGQDLAPAAGADDAERECQHPEHDLLSEREGAFDLLEGERVVPDHRRRVAVRVLHCRVVGKGPGGEIVNVPCDVEVEGLIHAFFEMGDVGLGAVPVPR